MKKEVSNCKITNLFPIKMKKDYSFVGGYFANISATIS